MRKLICISDLTIRGENTDDPFVEWSELKELLDYYDYLDLIRFVAAKHVHCKREGLNLNLLIEYLEQRK